MRTLVDEGVEGFTTPLVATSAGVAQGSVFRYFPTKAALLAATVEAALAAAARDGAESLAERLESGPYPRQPSLVRMVIEELWSVYTDERSLAAFEVRARCRTNPALLAVLQPKLEALDAGGGDLMALVLPQSLMLPRDDYGALAKMITSALQGRAVSRLSLPDPDTDSAVIEALVEAVEDRFARVLSRLDADDHIHD